MIVTIMIKVIIKMLKITIKMIVIATIYPKYRYETLISCNESDAYAHARWEKRIKRWPKLEVVFCCLS